MALSDTLTLVSLVVGALLGLAGQAIGLIVYWNGQMTALRVELAADLKKQQDAHDVEIEQLHGRINNIRKEFVTDHLYQRDLAELKQSQREILAAIQSLGVAMQGKVTELEKENAVQEYRLGAIDDKINGRNIGRSSTGA